MYVHNFLLSVPIADVRGQLSVHKVHAHVRCNIFLLHIHVRVSCTCICTHAGRVYDLRVSNVTFAAVHDVIFVNT